MAIKITWAEFLDLSDKTPVNEVINELSRIESTYSDTIKSIVSNNGKLNKAVSDLTDEAKSMIGALNGMNAATEENQKALGDAAKRAEDLAKSEAKLNGEIAENDKALIDLTTAVEGVSKAKEKLEKQNKAEEGSLTSLKGELKQAVKDYEAMGNSVDQAIKDEQINKIKTLSRAVIDGDKAVKEAKKAIDNAAGSYDHLSKAVVDAKVKLKGMENGLDATNKEAQDLKKFIKDGTDQLKAFDKELGDSGREVGNYELGLKGIDDRLGGMIGKAKAMGMEIMALFSNPILLGLAAVVALLAALSSAVKTYFETTGSGEDFLGRQSAIWGAFFDTLKQGWSDVGKAATDLVGGDVSKKLINGIIVGTQALFPILTPILGKIAKKFNELADQAVVLYDRLDDLGDRLTVNTITRAAKELAANELLDKSRNKLLYTDQQRLEFVKEAQKIQEDIASTEISQQKEVLKGMMDQLALKRKDIAFLKEEVKFNAEGIAQITETIKNSDLIDEQKKKLAEQITKIIELDAQLFQQQKRNNSTIIALTQEIEKAERERIERKVIAQQELNKVLINDAIKTNQELQKNANLSFAELTQLQSDQAAHRLQLMEIERQQAIAIVTKTAEDRIRAEGKSVADNIGKDEALKKELLRIQTKFNIDVAGLYDDLYNNIDGSFLKKLEQGYKNTYAKINTETNKELTELNKRLMLEGGNFEQFEEEKRKIIMQGQLDTLNEQLSFLEEQAKIYEKDAQMQIEIAQKVADVKRQLSDLVTNEYIKNTKKTEAEEKAFHQKLVGFAQQASNEVLTLLDASFAARIEKNVQYFNDQLSAEEEAKDRSLAIAGDDAQARALIEQDFANKKKAIEKQIAQEKRKQAIFQKALDATSIVISTAKGIATAVAESPLTFGLPWSAFVGVIGALQLATVLARPIPQFFKGTESSPAGLAWVAERGPELAISPSGKLTYYDKPQIANLEARTKIKTASKTSQLMKDAQMYGDGFMYDQLGSSFRDSDLALESVSVDLSPIAEAIDNSTKTITNAIKSQPQSVWDAKGHRQFERTENGRVLRLGKKYRF